jgi:hypothetical protein
VIYSLCVAAVLVAYRYYISLLAKGGEPGGSIERQDYDALRASLAGWTLFPHAFGLKKAAPLWTAPAFDRCLLLAIIYPIVTIFLSWWLRILVTVAVACHGLAFWRAKQVARLRWLFVGFALTGGLVDVGFIAVALVILATVGLVAFFIVSESVGDWSRRRFPFLSRLGRWHWRCRH